MILVDKEQAYDGIHTITVTAESDTPGAVANAFSFQIEIDSAGSTAFSNIQIDPTPPDLTAGEIDK